jgi:nickel/cobalt exporter
MDLHLHSHSQEISVGVCFVLGALHALEPGHGKTAFVAHLLTEKKNYLRPFALALTTAITHAASILLISLLVHGLLHTAFSVESYSVVRWMNLLSGVILVGLGIFIFKGMRSSKPVTFTSIEPLETANAHIGVCACPVHRLQSTHQTKTEKTWKTIAIGIAVGLIPCPSALAALSTALATRDLGSTILIIAMFSLGIFLSLTVIGAVIAKYSNRMMNNSFSQRRPMLASQIQIIVFMATGIWHISMF